MNQAKKNRISRLDKANEETELKSAVTLLDR